MAIEVAVTVCAVKLEFGAFALLMVTERLEGVKLSPFLLGVTV